MTDNVDYVSSGTNPQYHFAGFLFNGSPLLCLLSLIVTYQPPLMGSLSLTNDIELIDIMHSL